MDEIYLQQQQKSHRRKKTERERNERRERKMKKEMRNKFAIYELWFSVIVSYDARESARARAESSIKSTRDRVKCKYRLLYNIKINDSSFLL